MILKNNGDIYTYKNSEFVVGESIYANENSNYHGLFGVITEIRTGDDKETDNDTPDIYCRLDPPVLPYDIEEFEKRFSGFYGMKKTIDNIIFDFVILSPEMITIIASINKDNSDLEIFVVQEDVCSDGDSNTYTYLFTDYICAKQKLNELVEEDFRNGCVSVWKDRKEFVYENDTDSFEGWIDNRYCESHYSVRISKENVLLSSDAFQKIGKAYTNEYLRSCFKEQTEQWDGLDELGDDGYEKLLNSEELPHKIKEKLEADEAFLEKFWEAFSSVCFDIIRERKVHKNETQ